MRSEPAAASEAPLPADVLEQAAEWMLRLQSACADERDLEACRDWQRASPEHSRAWARVQRLQGLIARIPGDVAISALGEPASTQRRGLLKRLAMLASAVPAGWFAVRLLDDAGWRADERTATGERRTLRLPDGGTVELNTETALDLRYGPRYREIELLRGEIMIATAPDTAPSARPFVVVTPNARMQALGTRFSVLVHRKRSRIAVFEGAVRVHSGNASSRILQAGQQSWSDGGGIAPSTPADDSLLAWRHGMLVADRMPMSELAASLARYRRGHLRCDPEVAGIPVSGAFPIDDTDRSLAMLQTTYPVRVRHAAGGYWTVIGPPAR